MKKKILKQKKYIIIFLMIVIFLLCFIPNKTHNAKYQLNVEGPYGDIQAYHPKVINFSKQWNGYKYWMSYTPYPNGDDSKENPCIAVSNDLINWEIPSANINPLDIPEKTIKGKIYNSDAHLVYNNDLDQLECYWRYTENDSSYLYRRITKDGKNWEKKELVVEAKEKNIEDYISPAIIYEKGIYKMWYVPKSGYITYCESENGLKWKNKREIKLEYASKLETWHLDVVKTNKGYEMLVVAFTNRNNRNDMSLYYSYSTDGFNWSKAETILKPNTKSNNNWDNKGIYRSTFIYEDGLYYVFYSGTDRKYNHGIGMVFGRDLHDLQNNPINYNKENALEKFKEIVKKEKNK